MNSATLPRAITMMAGPQMLGYLIFHRRPSARWRGYLDELQQLLANVIVCVIFMILIL